METEDVSVDAIVDALAVIKFIQNPTAYKDLLEKLETATREHNEASAAALEHKAASDAAIAEVTLRQNDIATREADLAAREASLQAGLQNVSEREAAHAAAAEQLVSARVAHEATLAAHNDSVSRLNDAKKAFELRTAQVAEEQLARARDVSDREERLIAERRQLDERGAKARALFA